MTWCRRRDLAKALQFIADNCHKPIQVGDVAHAVGISRRSLTRLSRAMGVRTVAREITYLRFQRLKRLLAQTDKPLKELAKETGFKAANQLYVTFNRVEGVSPSEFRRRQKGHY